MIVKYFNYLFATNHFAIIVHLYIYIGRTYRTCSIAEFKWHGEEEGITAVSLRHTAALEAVLSSASL